MPETARVNPIAVTPRGHRSGCSASLPIDQFVIPIIEKNDRGVVLITAPPGGGKTLALDYLRTVLSARREVGFFDSHQIDPAFRAGASGLVILATQMLEPPGEVLDTIFISRWTLDDCMEYLHVRHRAACKSVLARLGRDPTLPTLEGSPQLLVPVMDSMAADERVDTCQDALRHHIRKIFPPAPGSDPLVSQNLSSPKLNDERYRWWRHALVQNICVAGWIVPQLASGYIPPQLQTVNAALIPEIASQVRLEPAAIDCLEKFVQSAGRSVEVPMVASILLAVDPNWRPTDGRGLNLCNAHLSNARWFGVALAGSLLMGANLSGADLSGSNLTAANAEGANLSHATLRGSVLRQSRFLTANLKGAILSDVDAFGADFTEAFLVSATLDKGVFDKATFDKTDLTNARCHQTRFCEASLQNVELEGADLNGAVFVGAQLRGVDFSNANLASVNFSRSQLQRCNMEYLDIPSADFSNAGLAGCLFTGSRITGGIFTGANLTNTGLADVIWENADLRDADLTQASFHMGSSRSGLVGSTIAGEGSRTGFYTDDFHDHDYKEAEEIRKACLVGANFLGAKVQETDFYLVDLRKAVYTRPQAEHFLRCSAILD
jgi:uncharacterized protein YjbI with pentapeptide repeats